MDKKLYVLQYDDDGYCAPYAKEIFTNKNKAFEYVKNNELYDFRCISIFEYDDIENCYELGEDLYYINKSHYVNPNIWDGFEDKTFISGRDYNKIMHKARYGEELDI